MFAAAWIGWSSKVTAARNRRHKPGLVLCIHCDRTRCAHSRRCIQPRVHLRRRRGMARPIDSSHPARDRSRRSILNACENMAGGQSDVVLRKFARWPRKSLVIYAKYDLTFLPEFSRQVVAEFERHRLDHKVVALPCGHYTTGEALTNTWMAGI